MQGTDKKKKTLGVLTPEEIRERKKYSIIMFNNV